MAKFYKSQQVVGKDDWISFIDKTYLVKKDVYYIVNDLLEDTCNCVSNNKWTLYWLGSVYPGGRKGGIRCTNCGKENIALSNKIWVTARHIEAVIPDIEKMEKMQAEVALLKLLASGRIKGKTYTKIMNMINGDEELFSLGKGLLKGITNEKEL